MDFKKLLDSYTENLSTDERSNVFAENEPNTQDTQDILENFVSNYDSNKLLIDDEEEVATDDSSENEDSIDAAAPTQEEPLSEDVLSALSDLDKPAEFMDQNSATNNSADEEEFTTNNDAEDPYADVNNEVDQLLASEENIDDDDDLDLDAIENDIANVTDDEEDFDLNDDFIDDQTTSEDDSSSTDIDTDVDFDNLNIDEEFSDETENQVENNSEVDSDDFDTESSSENNEYETPVEDNDDIGLDSFLDSLSDDEDSPTSGESNDSEDFEESFFEESDDSFASDDSDMFDIELPEEDNSEDEEEEWNNESEGNEEDGEIIMPDFSDTELSEEQKDTPVPKNPDNLQPAVYESVDKSINFDSWDSQIEKVEPEHVLVEINEEQAFKIRYKINGLNNKELRFKIREIITNPAEHSELFNKLVSLLLIDTPEEALSDFFEDLNSAASGEAIQLSAPATHIPSFLAHDVVDYQDTMYSIRNELLYNFKKYALYGCIALLTGVIAWFGFAQPLRVNNIFEQGLQAIRNDNFIEGESLFQQANQIAGAPVAEWYVKYGDVYYDKNLITEASEKYLSAIVIKPKDIDISRKASDFYTNLGPQYYSNAIAIMEDLTEYYPKKFEVWDSLGVLYINYAQFFPDDRNKQTDLLYDATDIYQEYIANNPKDPAPFYRILDIFIKIGNKEQIDKIANILIDLNPDTINIEMMTHLAKYYLDNRELNGAARIFKALTPMLDEHFRDTRKLADNMEKLYNISPENISNIVSSSYYEFARYKMLSSDHHTAGRVLTNSLLFNPQREEAYNLLGEAYLRSSESVDVKIAESKKLFEQALKINPDSYKAHVNLGHIYYIWDSEFGAINQAHDNALYHYKLAKALMPPNVKNTLMSYNHGWLEYNNSNANEAINIWSDIYHHDPVNPILSYALGSALYQSDKPQLAQVILEKSATNLEALRQHVPVPNLANKRHREIYTQLAKTYNNIGVINANYGLANQNRAEYFDSQALLNFYKAQDLADQVNNIYSTTEYNIGVLTRPNVKNRKTIFDTDIPKHTSLENPHNQFSTLLLETI